MKIVVPKPDRRVTRSSARKATCSAGRATRRRRRRAPAATSTSAGAGTHASSSAVGVVPVSDGRAAGVERARRHHRAVVALAVVQAEHVAELVRRDPDRQRARRAAEAGAQQHLVLAAAGRGRSTCCSRGSPCRTASAAACRRSRRSRRPACARRPARGAPSAPESVQRIAAVVTVGLESRPVVDAHDAVRPHRRARTGGGGDQPAGGEGEEDGAGQHQPRRQLAP